MSLDCVPPGPGDFLEALLTSTAVALAEIGDKTQLLAILLATRFKKPIPIICGIRRPIANHFLAALVGAEVAGLLDSIWFRYAIAACSSRWVFGR